MIDERDEQQEPSREEILEQLLPGDAPLDQPPEWLPETPEFTEAEMAQQMAIDEDNAAAQGLSLDDVQLYQFGSNEDDHEWDMVLDDDNQPAMMPRSLTTEERRERDMAKIKAMLAEQPDEFLDKLREASAPRVINFVIQNLIPERSVGFLVGESGAKKTFCALQMAICVAKGHHFAGLPVRKGSVLYFAPEDADGVKERYAGWCYSQNKNKPLDNMFIISQPVPLHRERELMKFAAKFNASPFFELEGNRPALVVIDTYSANSAGQKVGEQWREPKDNEPGRWVGGEPFTENNNDQAAVLLSNAQKLAEALDCAVVILHHSGKDATRGGRGASALKANSAFEITLSKHKDRDLFVFEHTKAKGSAMLERRAFRTKSVKLPPELVKAKREAMARMSAPGKDSPAAWHIGNNDSTLIVINEPELVKQDAGADDDEKPAEKRTSKTEENALRLTQFVHEYNERRRTSKRGPKLSKGALSDWARNMAEPPLTKVEFHRAFEHATKKQILIKMAGDETLTAMNEAIPLLGGVRDNDPRPTDWQAKQPQQDDDDLKDF